MRSRRKFIIDCSTAAAALPFGLLNSTGLAAHPGADFLKLENLSYASLASQINSLFRVHVSTGMAIDIELLEAPWNGATGLEAGTRAPADACNERFSLIFSGPGNRLIDSAIHRFEHPLLGKFEMYIGEFGPRGGKTVRYEAVFNRPATAC
jgi:hypothetical protein